MCIDPKVIWKKGQEIGHQRGLAMDKKRQASLFVKTKTNRGAALTLRRQIGRLAPLETLLNLTYRGVLFYFIENQFSKRQEPRPQGRRKALKHRSNLIALKGGLHNRNASRFQARITSGR